MNIKNLIVDVIKSVDIDDCYYIEASKKTDKYVIYSIYNETDTDIFDDNNQSVTYYIQLNYWFKNSIDEKRYKEIKNKMKEKGFSFDGCKDSKDGNYYGKLFDFKYEEFN
ncbi:hypothetical protein KLL36_01310 [Clostridioides difficile]|uniref:hypothetical protein n=1 Tax=Clostridioides difficile TaxID=1496 RepID=UPI000D1EF972|nr:hypothetical protein [Clostridioides difficile]MDL5064969.1 hypothetical protein [Clostridioides difficile]MDN9452084.1 hypothetical protein [Clostridioides difficile]HBF7900312.1 hypothetical protein [Clostridioides difficile]